MLYSREANITVAIIGSTLSLIFCLLRYYTRIFLLKSFGLDDYFSVIALVRVPSSRPPILRRESRVR